MNKKTDWTKSEPRYCERCGFPYYHRKNNEKAFQFKKRMFCSNKCKISYLSDFNRGKEHSEMYKKKMSDRIKNLRKKNPFSEEHNRKIAEANLGRKVSKLTRKKISDSLRGKMIGEKHWNWQGGITEHLARDILYPGYKEWRKKVFGRDNFKCVLCGNNKSGELQAHHIKSVKNYKDLILDVSNGLTLCKKCHKREHYGKN